MGTVGFFQEKEIDTSLLVKENFTNAICYGRTGSGKTTGFILPNIQNRLKQDHGLLIYDFKGTLADQVKVICDKEGKLDDLFEIGVPWGEKVNLLQNTTSKMVRDLVYTARSKTQDPYWSHAAANLLEAVYIIYKNMCNTARYLDKLNYGENHILQYRYTLNLKNLYNSISNAKSLNKFIKNAKEDIDIVKYFLEYKKISASKKTLNILSNIAIFIEKAEEAKESLNEYEGMSENNSEAGGKYGVLGVLSSSLSFVVNNEYIHNDQFDIANALRQKKIVIVNVSNINSLVASFLNMTIYKGLQNDIFKNDLTKVTIFIDEAQKVLESEYLPDVDVCRESKFEYILATQDKLLLGAKIGFAKTEELLRNVIEQYSFASNDTTNDTINLKPYEYKDLATNKTKFANKLYIDAHDIFESKWKYQTTRGIQNYVDYTTKERYIIKYVPSLFDENKVYIIFEDGSYTVVDYINNNGDILDSYNHFNIHNKPSVVDFRRYNIFKMYEEDKREELNSYKIGSLNKKELQRLFKKTKKDSILHKMAKDQFENTHNNLRKNHSKKVELLLEQHKNSVNSILSDSQKKYQITKKRLKKKQYDIPEILIPKVLKLMIKSKKPKKAKVETVKKYTRITQTNIKVLDLSNDFNETPKEDSLQTAIQSFSKEILSIKRKCALLENSVATTSKTARIVIDKNKDAAEELKQIKTQIEKLEISLDSFMIPF